MSAFKVVAAVVLLLLVLSAPLFCLPKVGFGADLAFAQDLLFGEGSLQLSADVRAMVSDVFQMRIPFALALNGQSFMGECGVMVIYYPWMTGPFMGLSVFQMGFSHECPHLPNLVNLNEVVVGWTFEFGPGLFVEPSLHVRDPSGTFSDEYSQIKGTFPCYTTFRAQLLFGWHFFR